MRTWFAADKTGFHMLHTLFQTSLKYTTVKRYDEWFVTKLLVDEGRVQGVVAVPLWVPQIGYCGGLIILSIALIDALKIFEGIKIEVHISNIHARDELHRHSITSSACTSVICGLGPYGYLAAILAAVQRLGQLPETIPQALHGLAAAATA